MKKECIYIDQLIIDYLNGQIDEIQKKELEAWVAASTANKQYYYEQTEIWLSARAVSGQPGNKEAAYKRFKQRVEAVSFKPWYLSLAVRYAASIIIFISLFGASFYFGGQYSRLSVAESLQSVEVPLGSRTRVVLQDGTSVWLNAGSKLTYSSRFLHDNRDVTLEGEGYFEVVHNDEMPFVVNADVIKVEVLGTKFNVKAYSDDEDVLVALAEGSINFIKNITPSSPLQIEPQQLVSYNRTSGQTSITTMPIDMMNNWIDGSHFFNEQSLIEITDLLEKSFDVKFIFRDKLKQNLIFYADFKGDENLTDILAVLSSSGKFNYKKLNNIVEIY